MDFFESIQSALDSATAWLGGVNDWLYTFIMIAMLVGTGVYLTIRSRALQVRHFGAMMRYVVRSRGGAKGGISSFQAFAMGMSTRIGIGNITGVALAMILGGPGALLWMWLTAFFGMATAFAEATLAQVFKQRHGDGAFRGGPASYIMKGLKSWPFAATFAVSMIFAMIIAMPMVQSNAIAQVVEGSHGIDPWVTGVVISVFTAVVLIGGVRRIAQVTEVLAPLMAIFYIVAAIAIIALNLDQLPNFFVEVFASAFGLREAFVGTGSGLIAALMNGVRRGLFSNEAGLGTNPNAAATATVAHPVQQALLQSFGVFVDTMLVCSATGFIIMVTGALDFTTVTPDDAANITTNAITGSLGTWMAWPMSIMIFFFGVSSSLGAYAYGEANLVFLKAPHKVELAFRWMAVIFSFVGSVLALTFVWAVMDTAMFVVTILNLIALLALSGWVIATLRDYERQLKNGVKEPVFRAADAGLPGKLDGDIWV
ncbi:MAG: alanine:cation symporter family protein [Actinomycetaceae bacterium]|nr:alanine:cation symporter family protein [Actinomycetaceae bacterium]